jgi:hypothetical protein
MISVCISINGTPIMGRSAVNRGEIAGGYTKYELDDGQTILHDRDEGAAILAIKMLEAIREQGVNRAASAAAANRAVKAIRRRAKKATGDVASPTNL